MSPVMARCSHGWPQAECVEHGAPTPPAPRTPADDDPDGLTQTPAVVYVAAGCIIVVTAAWVAVLGAAAYGAWKLAAWAVGLLP